MICSSSALFDVEVSFIRDILRANGYSLNFLSSHIHKFKKSLGLLMLTLMCKLDQTLRMYLLNCHLKDNKAIC